VDLRWKEQGASTLRTRKKGALTGAAEAEGASRVTMTTCRCDTGARAASLKRIWSGGCGLEVDREKEGIRMDVGAGDR
jgi:hypothetical protein